MMMRISIIIVGFVLLSAAAPGVQAQPQPVQALDGEAIAAIWKERQDKVKTATFETTRTTLWPRGSLTTSLPILFTYRSLAETGVSKKSVDGPVPASDYRVTVKEQILIEGEKIRYDYSSIQWSHSRKVLYLKPERTAFDGKQYRTVFEKETGEEEGAISRHSAYPDANLLGMSAVLNSLRGRSKVTFLKPHDFVATGRQAVIDGYDCLEYHPPKLGDQVCNIWLSPAQGWNIVRVENIDEKQYTRVDRRYKSDPVVGWVPSSWEMWKNIDGALMAHVKFEVTSYTINSPIEPGTFTLQFTPGMKVFHEDPPGGVVGQIQPDGQILPDDGRPAYFLPGMGELSRSEAIRRSLFRYAPYVLIVLLVSLVLWRGIRRYRRQQHLVSPAPPPTSEGVPS